MAKVNKKCESANFLHGFNTLHLQSLSKNELIVAVREAVRYGTMISEAPGHRRRSKLRFGFGCREDEHLPPGLLV